MSIKKFKEENTIAYDKQLREKLRALHDSLGEEVTDVATAAMDYGGKFSPEAKITLKLMSELASDLSVALINAKSDKEKLSPEEQQDYENISALAENLGNLQFKLNRIIQKSEEFKKVAQELQEEGMNLAENIMDAQESFRMVRANINDLAFLSADPNVAYKYRDELAKEAGDKEII